DPPIMHNITVEPSVLIPHLIGPLNGSLSIKLEASVAVTNNTIPVMRALNSIASSSFQRTENIQRLVIFAHLHITFKLISYAPYGLYVARLLRISLQLFSKLADMYHHCIFRFHKGILPDMLIDLIHTKHLSSMLSKQ